MYCLCGSLCSFSGIHPYYHHSSSFTTAFISTLPFHHQNTLSWRFGSPTPDFLNIFLFGIAFNFLFGIVCICKEKNSFKSFSDFIFFKPSGIQTSSSLLCLGKSGLGVLVKFEGSTPLAQLLKSYNFQLLQCQAALFIPFCIFLCR